VARRKLKSERDHGKKVPVAARPRVGVYYAPVNGGEYSRSLLTTNQDEKIKEGRKRRERKKKDGK